MDLMWKSILIRELSKNDLLCSEEKYRLSREGIWAIGRREWEVLEKELPQGMISFLLKWYGTINPKGEMQRILGFGNVLTDFLIRPSEVGNDRFNSLCSIGALTNLIICVFDSLVDNHEDCSWVEDYARKLDSGFRTSFVDNVLYRKNEQYRLMISLSRLFIKRLDETIKSDDAKRLVLKYVKAAFAAELKTLHQTEGISTVSRKSALAILLLGVPSLALRCQEKNRTGMAEFTWLFRVGELLGRVDDLCDYHTDAENNAANYYLKTGGLSNEFDANSEILKLVSDAKRVLIRYERSVDFKDYSGKSSYLLLAIVSWIGGLHVEPALENTLQRKS